ncbi:hypothetical protein GCM10010303_82180 [Streptomyces purpurascens]|nr:hypothetical protein GCM10010303_82180 [Streptomyces purpurascens]
MTHAPGSPPEGSRNPGTARSGPRRAQAVLVLRWFVDGTRVAQLARDNGISNPTAYRYLYEGLTVLSDHAPDLATALERAVAAGYTHLNLDGTVVRRTASPPPAPTARICGGPAITDTTAATCRSSPPRTAGRCGARQCGRDASTTQPVPAPTVSSTP